MIDKICSYIKKIFNKIELSKINYLNHKFKKYIIKYEIVGDNIIIYNSCGNVKTVKNTILNKVKIMEIVDEHKKEINIRIKDYYDNLDDNKNILLFSSLLVILLGCINLFSFFVGSYILFIICILSFIGFLIFYIKNTYYILLNRKEIKRLVSIIDGNLIIDDKELIEIFKDIYTIIKSKIYTIILKVIDIYCNVKVKFN